jgi:predicted DCC family thiol-disulfide oxidoreductase YuxK
MPNQTPGILAQYGLTRAAADRDALAITAGGERLAGGAAVRQVFAALGGPWAVLAWVVSLAPVAWVADRVYRRIATNRRSLSRFWGTVPECARPGVRCEEAR